LKITIQTDTGSQSEDSAEDSESPNASPIIPSPRTGFNLWPEGWAVSDFDRQKSHGSYLYCMPDKVIDNLQDRSHLKSLTGYTRDLSVPRHNIINPQYDPRPEQHSPLRLGRGEYEKLEDVQQADCPPDVWLSWIEDEDLRDQLRQRLIAVPEAPNIYPMLSKWTEEGHHQHVLPSTAETCPNFYVSLTRLFGEGNSKTESTATGEEGQAEKVKLLKICPEHSQGCPWSSTYACSYRDHVNLSHLPFPMLLLCPAAEHDCAFVTGAVGNFDCHLRVMERRYQKAKKKYENDVKHNAKAEAYNRKNPHKTQKMLRVIDKFPTAIEADHHRMYLLREAKQNEWKDDINILRVFNRKVQIPRGLPPIVCFYPKNKAVPPSDKAVRAKARWIQRAREEGLEMMPGFPNTIAVQSEDNPKTPIEKAIASVFRHHGDAERSLKKTAKQCATNYTEWDTDKRLFYPMPPGPRPGKPRTKTLPQPQESTAAKTSGSDRDRTLSLEEEEEEEDNLPETILYGDDEEDPPLESSDETESSEEEMSTADTTEERAKSPSATQKNLAREHNQETSVPTSSVPSSGPELHQEDLRLQLTAQHSPQKYKELTTDKDDLSRSSTATRDRFVNLIQNAKLRVNTTTFMDTDLRDRDATSLASADSPAFNTTSQVAQQPAATPVVTVSTPKQRQNIATSSPYTANRPPSFLNMSTVTEQLITINLADFLLPEKPTEPPPFEPPPLVAETREDEIMHARRVEAQRNRAATEQARYRADIEEWHNMRYNILAEYIKHHLNVQFTHTTTVTMEEYRRRRDAEQYLRAIVAKSLQSSKQ